MQTIVWGLEDEFNEMLWAMVARTNGLKNCNDSIKLIRLVNGVVKVDLDQMPKHYTSKFIDDDFMGYCSKFLNYCKPNIQVFLHRHQLTSPWTFLFEFRLTHQRFDARVYFN